MGLHGLTQALVLPSIGLTQALVLPIGLTKASVLGYIHKGYLTFGLGVVISGKIGHNGTSDFSKPKGKNPTEIPIRSN
jgi:hypothetical protein